jgi:DNA-binding NarL/FixJ family response regulator
MISVLIIQHPPAVRLALHDRLSLERDITLVGEADDEARALTLAPELQPQVIVIDGETPGLDVLGAIHSLRELSKSSAFVVLTHNPVSVAQRLTREGALVVSRFEGAEALLRAIRSTASRGL